jgi:hypothetical protein
MPAEKDLSGNQLPQNSDGVSKSRPIFFRMTERWPAALLLPEGEITPKNEIAVIRESFTQRDQERSVAIRSRAVSQDQGIAVCLHRSMEKSADSRIERVIQECVCR